MGPMRTHGTHGAGIGASAQRSCGDGFLGSESRSLIKDWSLGQSEILNSKYWCGRHDSDSDLTRRNRSEGMGGDIFYKPEVAITTSLAGIAGVR